jgi:hypothetical protein
MDDFSVGGGSPGQDGRITTPSDSSAGGHEPLAVATYLWGEYQYRHDMVWRLVFRVTSVAVALMITPFLANAVARRALGNWLVVLPILAVLVILLGFWALPPELRRLDRVKTAYQYEQKLVLDHIPSLCKEPHDPSSTNRAGWLRFISKWARRLRRIVPGPFTERVWTFLFGILVATVSYLILFIIFWRQGLAEPK